MMKFVIQQVRTSTVQVEAKSRSEAIAIAQRIPAEHWHQVWDDFVVLRVEVFSKDIPKFAS